MNYEIDRKKSVIKERETEHEIVQSSDREKLKSLCRHLNLGGGFDGWTPKFFMFPSILVLK